MDSQKWLAYSNFKPFPVNLGYRLEGAKLEAEERRLAGAFDVCTVATQAELKTLAGYGTRVCADWFPNGVDINYFSPSAEPYDPDVISFVGRMDYYPNQRCVLDFCRQTFPRIRQRRPEAKFLIVGADPAAAIRRLGQIAGYHGDWIGTRCTALSSAVGRDGRSARNRARDTEQDPRGDVRRGSGRDEQRRGRRRRCDPRMPHFSSPIRRREVAAATLELMAKSAASRRLPPPGGRACCRTTPGTSRCAASMASSSGA